jgi:membrane associated rhomboid family serine protease
MNVLEDIKQNFLFSKNAIKRIITINVMVFLVVAVVNVIAYLLKSSFASSSFTGYLTLPASFSAFIYKPWSIITYMFLHDGFLHILFNMLWLYWMGNILYEYLGNKRVYQAYFIGGIFGGIIFMLSYNIFPAFEHIKYDAYALGASAGVLSVVVATATLLPNYEIRLMLLGSIKLKWIAVISVMLDVISIPNGNPGGHIAHLGGALFGFLFIKQLQNNTILDKVWGKMSTLFNPSKKLKVHHKNATDTSSSSDKPSQQEIDAILDKISRSGYDSLSKREKEQLFKASKD